MSPISVRLLRYRTIHIVDNRSDLAAYSQCIIHLRLMKLSLVLSSCKGCATGQQSSLTPRFNCDKPQFPLQSTTRWRYGDGVHHVSHLTAPLHTATPAPQRAVKGEIPPITDSALRAGGCLCVRFACVELSSDSCACVRVSWSSRTADAPNEPATIVISRLISD